MCKIWNFIYRNIGEALVSKGFATVIKYRQDDDQRASDYDHLLAAEARAAKDGKGVSKKDSKAPTVVDITGVRRSLQS